MTTANGTYPNRLDPRTAQQEETPAMNWEERKEPEFKQFAEGDVLEGVLTNVERIMIGDKANPKIKKPVTRYTVQEMESGEPVCFLGSYQLDVKLRPQDIGHYVRIINEGKDPAVTRNGNAMTRYKVLVTERPAPGWANDGSQITDADLPAFMQ
jgi:hypothetical protein